ncbi:PglZ domain-containing protein [Bradyrhizobium sp. AUGA SZCCT0274]|uniref:PglZ domain-containing protein n=1 Tax=Bradyrhizobium sp. AUGA SZCCT0274 TaxID=2807670 RepID=UPI001BA48C68|nr:PglZ domain-containing protein [Bradyrhizobium sp. AUGA SZCCT0274]MBR1240289.1 PglZ domain-containing protein [Bradyrhizobium sp. AUGA SZCCT0274]
MSIAAFIRDTVLHPRLREAGCMVVYDPERRYHGICASLENDRTRVVDASESSIESRLAAIVALREVGRPKSDLDAILIYVPKRRSETDEEKQVDPFSIYAESGAVFPRDDGDEYLSLCLRAKPDHATEVRRVFAGSPNGPAFSVIDAIGAGASWPQLRSALKVESGREILAALLAPSTPQAEALKSTDGWIEEARAFFKATLVLSVKTRSKTWNALADELWRFVLFSEFVFDLPGALPDALRGVPHAPAEAKPIVEDVCDRLRSDPNTRNLYIERAEAIEAELDLAGQCRSIEELGERDTFPFEERTFLKAAIKGITANDTDATRRVLARHKNSVWRGQGESRAQWELVRAGLSLVEACEDNERQLPEHARSQADLLDFYLSSLREVDRLQREFEQAVGDFLDSHGLMQEVIDQARVSYRGLAEKVQTVFVKHIETTGWPPQGRHSNSDAFDRLLADRLRESGRRVAYLMVDALRYELGVVLEKMLAEDGPVELQAAYAQLPTITVVGMASLLPGARTELTLGLEAGSLAPKLGGARVGNVSQRMDVLRKRLGDRFQEMPLSDFVRGKPKISEKVDLLVLRSTEIDSQLESNPETTLGLIPGTLKLIRVALHKLRGMGFKEAVIVTDHGFFLNAQAEAGDVCSKPQGNWPVTAHDRMMLGDGNADSHNAVIGAEKLGVRGDFTQVALPRSMAPYRAGHLYFHGGASLAEAVVPVLVARLDAKETIAAAKVTVELSYKNGAKRITTRVPVIDIRVQSDDMFSQDVGVEVLIEAQDAKGNTVGEPRPGGDVNPATRTLTLMPGQSKQIALRMDSEFEGKFSVKALNPTTLASFSALALETDYTV